MEERTPEGQARRIPGEQDAGVRSSDAPSAGNPAGNAEINAAGRMAEPPGRTDLSGGGPAPWETPAFWRKRVFAGESVPAAAQTGGPEQSREPSRTEKRAAGNEPAPGKDVRPAGTADSDERALPDAPPRANGNVSTDEEATSKPPRPLPALPQKGETLDREGWERLPPPGAELLGEPSGTPEVRPGAAGKTSGGSVPGTGGRPPGREEDSSGPAGRTPEGRLPGGRWLVLLLLAAALTAAFLRPEGEPLLRFLTGAASFSARASYPVDGPAGVWGELLAALGGAALSSAEENAPEGQTGQENNGLPDAEGLSAGEDTGEDGSGALPSGGGSDPSDVPPGKVSGPEGVPPGDEAGGQASGAETASGAAASVQTVPVRPSDAGEIRELQFTGGDGYIALNPGYIRNATDWTNGEVRDILSQPTGTAFAGDGRVEVLILSTHATEAYEPGDYGWYDPDFVSRSEDPAGNVTAVAAALAARLREHGVGVIHDVTQFDSPQYAGAYDRSREAIRAWLEEYPTIRVVLDVHRDALESDRVRLKPTARLGEVKAAQVMIISGCDNGSFGMPGWRENLRFAAGLESEIEAIAPGLTRPVLFDYRKYNQDLSPGALLLEIGSSGNTLEEAKRTAAVVADALYALCG